MACLFFIRCSTSLYAPKTLIQEIHPRRSANGRFLSPATSRTVIKLLAPKCSDRGIFSVNKSCHHRIVAPRLFCEPVSRRFNVRSSTSMIILGFWVGPDIEDGWGFVEALVSQIF